MRFYLRSMNINYCKYQVAPYYNLFNFLAILPRIKMNKIENKNNQL